MKIDINQKKIAVGEKYTIEIGGELRYTAATKIFRLLTEMHLFKSESDYSVLTIRRHWSFFKAKYSIELRDGNALSFNTITFWRPHYQCYHGESRYDLFGHKGRKYSIFKNGSQIAWWDKNAVSIMEGDHYTITADDDYLHELIIAFCLIIDDFSSGGKKGAVSFDFGNLGFEVQPFNPMWLPKKS